MNKKAILIQYVILLVIVICCPLLASAAADFYFNSKSSFSVEFKLKQKNEEAVIYGISDNRSLSDGITERELTEAAKTAEISMHVTGFNHEKGAVSAAHTGLFNIDIINTDNAYFRVMDMHIEFGVVWDALSFTDIETTAIISRSLADSLFIAKDCTGQDIFVNYTKYTIVGVCSGKEDFVFLPTELDKPLTFFAVSEDGDLPSYVKISKLGGNILDKITKFYSIGNPEFLQ